MITSRVAALNDLLRSHGAEAQATQAHSSSSADPKLDELDVWSEKAINRFAREEDNQPAKEDNDEMPGAILVAGDHFHDTHAGVRATQAHFLSSANPATGELDVWNEKAINQARFDRGSASFLMKPGAPHDRRTGRFTHSEDSIRAEGYQGVEGEDGEESDEDDGYDADGAQRTTPGGGERTAEGHSEGPQDWPTTSQMSRVNLDQRRQISATEMIRLLIESQRLAVETRAVAAAKARVAQEAHRLVMGEARTLALAESETHKWTGVATGYFETVVVFVQKNGLDDAAVIQSGANASRVFAAFSTTRRDQRDLRGHVSANLLIGTEAATTSGRACVPCVL